MSECAPAPWAMEPLTADALKRGPPYPSVFVLASDGTLVAQALGRLLEHGASIAEDHNACLGIVDPATTVPELVAFIRKIAEDEHDESCDVYAYEPGDCTCYTGEAITLLAKTGQTNPPASAD